MELHPGGERGQNRLGRAARGLDATLQASRGFLKVSFDKAKVFIKPVTQGDSTVVAVEARLQNTSTQRAFPLAGSHSRLLAAAVGIGG